MSPPGRPKGEYRRAKPEGTPVRPAYRARGRCRGARADAGARPPRGAALLVAMVILTLVGTLAAGMVWQQWRALQVESAERLRVRAAWILTGAVDFGRVILRLDARTPGVDHLGEPWATQLQESSLASLLAADRSNNVGTGPEVYLRGTIADAQARYNLRNLVDNERRLVPAEVETLGRLCATAGVAPEVAQAIADGLKAAWAAEAGQAGDDDAPMAPRSVAQLGWLGIDAASVAALEPFLVLLPEATPLNLNTASAEVLAAVVSALDAGSAQRLTQARQARPFRSIAEAGAQIAGTPTLDSRRVAVASNYFEVSGRLRADDRRIEERMLVVRRGRDIVPLWRERRALDPDGR
jgi:general secretion pathway protein K